jgi:hypothetical protein
MAPFGTAYSVRCVGITDRSENNLTSAPPNPRNGQKKKLPGQGSNLRMAESKSAALPLGYRALRGTFDLRRPLHQDKP